MGILKRIGKFNIVVCSIIIITLITPRNVNLVPVQFYTSFKAEHLYDEYVDTDGELSKAKRYVIEKVTKSKHIKNKQQIIDRINDVHVSTHTEDNELLALIVTGYRAVYFSNWFYGQDYVVIRGKTSDRYTLTHELNHLIDVHQRPIPKFDYDDLLDKSKINVDYYRNYYSDWGYKYNLGYDEFNGLSNHKYYLTSEEEVYARISTLKYRLVEIGIMDVDETLSEKHVIEFKELISVSLPFDLYEHFVMSNGFMVLLPLIDWDRVDILETI